MSSRSEMLMAQVGGTHLAHWRLTSYKTMFKDIKEVLTIEGKKVCRLTTPDQRFYGKEIINQETGAPEIKWYPSITWIKDYYYTSPYLVKWIASQGMTEAERIKKEAGIKGDKVHQATEDIDRGIRISIKAQYENKQTGEREELTAEEIEAIVSYKDWVDKAEPELMANEMVVFGDDYAGTLDRIFRIDGQIYIVDLKTSKSIWKDMIIQISAYSHANINYQKLGISEKEWKERKLAILQIGYKRNKNGYKFTEVDDRYDLFEIAYRVWAEENKNVKPFQKDYPLVIKSKFREKEIKEKTAMALKKPMPKVKKKKTNKK